MSLLGCLVREGTVDGTSKRSHTSLQSTDIKIPKQRQPVPQDPVSDSDLKQVCSKETPKQDRHSDPPVGMASSQLLSVSDCLSLCIQYTLKEFFLINVSVPFLKLVILLASTAPWARSSTTPLDVV